MLAEKKSQRGVDEVLAYYRNGKLVTYPELQACVSPVHVEQRTPSSNTFYMTNNMLKSVGAISQLKQRNFYKLTMRNIQTKGINHNSIYTNIY